jgi:hypothetical protein
MLNSYWLVLPFLLQALLMAADEFRFHRKRGLPKWERIGHPLDTLTVVLCLSWILHTEPDDRSVAVFVFLAVLSCVFITKDEHVHLRRCSAAEQWIHAALFILHPLVLASGAFLWPAARRVPQSWPLPVSYSGFERTFLIIAWTMMLCFSIYQLVFWNLVWSRKIKTS